MSAVLDSLGDRLVELSAAGADEVEIEAAIDRQLRVIARTILDNYPVEELQTRFPYMAELIAFAPHGFGSALSSRLALAHTVAMRIGWRLFGDFLITSADLKAVTKHELSLSLNQATRRILSPSD